MISLVKETWTDFWSRYTFTVKTKILVSKFTKKVMECDQLQSTVIMYGV